jgi:hypothetical protein
MSQLGDILEPKVTQITVKCVPGRGEILGTARQQGPVDKVDVNPAVTVVVKRGQTRGYRLHDISSSAATIGVVPGNPATASHISKNDSERELPAMKPPGCPDKKTSKQENAANQTVLPQAFSPKTASLDKQDYLFG